MTFEDLYELPTFTPAEMLGVVGLTERTLQVWIQRGYLQRASRPGRGVHREYSLSDLLFLSFLRVASTAHVPLADASMHALYLFPSLKAVVPAAVKDVVRGCGRHDTLPQLMAVLCDGREPLIVSKDRMGIHRGADWGIGIDLTRLISTTAEAARSALARRANAQRAAA